MSESHKETVRVVSDFQSTSIDHAEVLRRLEQELLAFKLDTETKLTEEARYTNHHPHHHPNPNPNRGGTLHALSPSPLTLTITLTTHPHSPLTHPSLTPHPSPPNLDPNTETELGGGVPSRSTCMLAASVVHGRTRPYRQP